MFRRENKRKFLIVAGLLIALVAALSSPTRADRDKGESPFAALGIFARALVELEVAYVEPIDQRKLVYGAIRGMLEALDPHSSFLDPDEYRALASGSEGRFAGVGVQILVRDGWLTVVRVFEGGPADRAGLVAGDRFIRIAGYDARDMQISKASKLMRGEPGTSVDVLMRRDGEEKDIAIELTRAIVHVPAVEGRVLPGGVVYTKIMSFQTNTIKELRAMLDRASHESRNSGGVRGLLIDLRNNGGGLLQQAILVADEFLAEGQIVSTRGRHDALLSSTHASKRNLRPNWPIVILVNGYTASASEIVAGALRDHKRAILVGTKTFGKGSVQSISHLPDNSALKFTTARYFTPAGISIQAAGIEPDIEVAYSRKPVGNEGSISESDLEGHLDAELPTKDDGPHRHRTRSGRDLGDQPMEPFANDQQARIGYQTLKSIIALSSQEADNKR